VSASFDHSRADQDPLHGPVLERVDFQVRYTLQGPSLLAEMDFSIRYKGLL
jgi:hypothetical protein